MDIAQLRTTGWAIIETIRNYGVDTVFGIPGTHNLEFYRPLGPLGIRAVTTRHEQGAGYGADGWSLQSSLPGVVITTSGPGLLNALSSAGTAFCESRPMLILAPGPDRGTSFEDAGTLHETKDQLGAAAAVVERARRVDSAQESVEAVHEAFTLFATGRPRPVYIEVPLDLLQEEIDISQLTTVPRVPSRGGELPLKELTEARDLLAEAEHPVVLAGGGARHASAELKQLAESLQIPVVTTLNGKGAFDEHHPLSLRSNLRSAAVREYVRTADVLLVAGSKLGESELWVPKLDATGTVIRVDILESQIEKNQKSDVAIVADSRHALAKLAEDQQQRPRDTMLESTVANLLGASREESLNASPFDTRLSEHLTAVLPENAIVSTDSSQIGYMGLLSSLAVSQPNSTPYMGTYATLGYGLPAALGARIAAPHRPTFAVVGDGALMFSMQELITVVEQQADVTVIVVDNGGYSEIKQNELDAGIAPIGVDLTQPEWVKLADAFGGTGHRVHTFVQLKETVEIALASGGLQLIHIPVAEYSKEFAG